MIVVNSRFLTKDITGIVRYASEITPLLKEFYSGILFITPKGVRQKKLFKKLDAFEYGYLKGYLWEQVELPLLLKKLGNPLLFNLSYFL